METRTKPTRRVSKTGPIHELDHPLARHYLTQLRAAATPPAEFRRLTHHLASLLAFEATKDLAEERVEIQTPLAAATGSVLRQRIGLVPILRAGLGMVDPILDLIAEAEVWHLGIYRDEATKQPVEYYSRLPATEPVDVALVLDPMLATGGSVLAALTTLRDWGVPTIKVLSVIASREGLQEVETQFPDALVYVCAVDPDLNDRKFIVPGLGDAGDRIFNTPPRG